MSWQTLPELIPYIVSLAISTSVGLFAWRRRATVGARSFALIAWGDALWTLGYIFELSSATLPGKIFWDDFQYIGGVLSAVALLVFSVEYTGRGLRPHRGKLALAALPGVIFLALAATNPLHHLVQANEKLISAPPFGELTYDFTPAVIAVFIWSVGLTVASLGLLFGSYVRPHRLYRAQVGVIILAVVVPLAGNVLTVAGIKLGEHRDTTPITFAAANLIMAWGLFRYRLLDLVPVARSLVFDSMSDAVVVLDAQNRVVDLNPAAAVVVGRAARELVGRPIDDVYASWSDLVERFRDVEELHTELVAEVGGESRWYDMRITPLRDRQQRLTGRIIVTHDITHRKGVEEELRAANRVKDEFVANVTHELKTPITSIKLFQELLAGQGDPAKRAAYLDSLGLETQRLEMIIENLLRLSRMDLGRATYNPIPTDLNALISIYVTAREPQAQREQLALSAELATDNPRVMADRGLLILAFSIMLTNALNYTPAGGEVRAATVVRDLDGEHWAGFSITDTGPGVLPEELPQLFSRFFRGSAGRTSGVSGTGLGLALAHQIMKMHEGRIEVESEGLPGKGSSFTAWLPRLE